MLHFYKITYPFYQFFHNILNHNNYNAKRRELRFNLQLPLIFSPFGKNNLKCLEYEFNIIPKRAMLHIFQIQLYLLLHDYMNIVIFWIFSLFHKFILVTELDAGRVSNAWANVKDVHLLGSPVVHVVAHLRTRTDKAHVAKKDVDQLGKFIKLKLTDEVTRACYTWVAATDGNKTALIRANTHRAELKDAEILILITHTHLTVEHRTFRVQLNPDSKYYNKGLRTMSPQPDAIISKSLFIISK